VSEERPHKPRVIDADTEHMIKNHLAVIAGYCELLLADMPDDDPRHADLQEINRSVLALIALFRRDAKV
jgi:hypothetical protein